MKEPEEKPRLQPASPRWLRPILATLVIIIGVLVFALKQRVDRSAVEAGPPPAAAPAPAAAAVPPLSPARELVAKAIPLIHGLDATRRTSPSRRNTASARSSSTRMMARRGRSIRRCIRRSVIAAGILRPNAASRRGRPRSAPSGWRRSRRRRAWPEAGAWATFGINRDEREKLLREILRDEPDNQEVLRFLAVTVLAKPGGLEEALALNEQSAALPGGDPLALFNNARYLWTAGQPARGCEMLQRSLAQRKFTSALVLKVSMELIWRGDLAAAEATLSQIPASTLQEDRANYSAGLLRYYQRDAAGALRGLGSLSAGFLCRLYF